MRQVGDITGLELATRFVDFLSSQEIGAELREESATTYRIWIIDEDDLALAEHLFSEFVKNPNAKRFDTAARVPKTAPAAPQPRRATSVDDEGLAFGFGQVTIAMILISIAFTFLRDMPGAAGLVEQLFFSEQLGRDFPEIRAGQVWRLVTPIFLHGSWLHLIFNMLWLLQLGGAIERLEKSVFFAVFVLTVGVLCNTAQYLVSGPAFMGMSGVVYGMLGYIWMMSKYKAGMTYSIPQQTVTFMLIWLVICVIGLIPNVANTQHIVGLAIGVLWGYIRSGRLREIRRKQRFKQSQR